jgi:ssDNA-binding Zn-finger/Zn-ribbon topoisomerase 1
VFLGADYSPVHIEPLLFETMIFGGVFDGYRIQYTTREDALNGHAKAVCLAALNAMHIPKMIRKWDFEKHEYERIENKNNVRHLLGDPDPEEIIRCANCGKEVTVGESMVSKQWQDDIGFGYLVCMKCSITEWAKFNSEKDKNRT